MNKNTPSLLRLVSIGENISKAEVTFLLQNFVNLLEYYKRIPDDKISVSSAGFIEKNKNRSFIIFHDGQKKHVLLQYNLSIRRYEYF